MVALGASLFIGGCAASAHSDSSPAPTAEDQIAGEPLIRLAIVGDSLSEGSVADGSTSDPGSWTEYLSERFTVEGGARIAGATSEQLAARTSAVDAQVLVVMAGTNDVLQSVDPMRTLEAIERIEVQVQVDVVIISAVPPSNARPDAAMSLNQHLRLAASSHGWIWIDPWEQDRDGELWSPMSSLDGTHGTADAYRRVAERVSGLILTVCPTAPACAVVP